jgi:hypothetical protein
MLDKGYLLGGTLDMILAQVQFVIEQTPRGHFVFDRTYYLRLANDDLRSWVEVYTIDAIGLYKVGSPPLPHELEPGPLPHARLMLFMPEPDGVRVVEYDSVLFENCPQLLEFRCKLKARLQERFPMRTEPSALLDQRSLELTGNRQQKGDLIKELTVQLGLSDFEGILGILDEFTIEHAEQRGTLVIWQVVHKSIGPLGYIAALPVRDSLTLKFYRMEWDIPCEAIEFMNDDGEAWVSCGTHGSPRIMVQEVESAFRKLDISYKDKLESSEGSTSEKPWEKIPDRKWNRFALEHWHKGYTVPEIADKIPDITEKTVRNRLSELRQSHGTDVVPTNEQRKKL